jgi:hypothetical protein
MDRFEGLYYDGQSSRAIPVVVVPLQNNQLLLRGDQRAVPVPRLAALGAASGPFHCAA